MRINIVTLFTGFFEEPLGLSIPGRAAQAGLVEYRVVDLRDYTAPWTTSRTGAARAW